MRNRFDVRVLLSFIMLSVLMFTGVLRLYKIATDTALATRQYTNYYRIKLTNIRGSIFDKELNAITNSSYKYMAVVSPTPLGISVISGYLYEDERLDGIVKTLKSGKPVAVEVDEEIVSSAVKCIKVYNGEVSEFYPAQLIGYTDAQNHGVSGIESAYDQLLYTDKTLDAVLSVDALGNVLNGVETEIIGDDAQFKSGVALTIDTAIQRATYKAMQTVQSGAAVVGEIGSGKIRAMVSKPNFDIKNVSEYLDSADSPLINRALSAYNVGSAFKPCVAAGLLENGINSKSFYCSGSSVINGHKFNCHKSGGHGYVELNTALTNSCNVFFYNVCSLLGADNLYNMATIFGFGKEFDIGGIKTSGENLTNRNTLKTSATALANLSIGQGELLLSPVAMLTLYEAIANGGVYYMPTVIEGTVKKGVLTSAKTAAPTYAFSKNTADILKEYLVNVVENGTGVAAKPNMCSAAGKTATAETGWQKNGRLIQNSWFCGFFPADKPKYVVIVLVEDEYANGTTAAPIFKKIADAVMQIKTE